MNTDQLIQSHPNPALLILRGVRLILKSRRRWTKGAMARDRFGETVMSYGSDASCFCLYGAVRRASDELGLTSYRSWAITSLNTAAGGCMITFNDREKTRHQDVIALLDRAIQEAA
ncbi:hypothetical protein IZ6_25370 [Terrihabitans soli]|uniref:Uncharacterized protein n=1 Tax=Terrihabitans soli TaxID=708113 RepID=A0A6S6QX21_9HYPH|nr:hypothetical protein [Terrihabitans soli]BCJ91802.1 hypothetical protein IZ6_25370 [Terrihabitans soli]